MAGTTFAYVPSWRYDVRACAVTVFISYPLHKFRLTSSFSYWWLWHISVLTSYLFFSTDYFWVWRFSFVIFSFCLYTRLYSFFFYPTLTTFPTRLYSFVTQISVTCLAPLLTLAVELLFCWNFWLMSCWWVSMLCLGIQKWPPPTVWHHRVPYLQNFHGIGQYTTENPIHPFLLLLNHPHIFEHILLISELFQTQMGQFT